MFRLLCILLGYALGCVQSAYIIGKLTRGIDIREHGSKNSGFTNANRVMGFKVGVWIFIADVGKAVLAFLIACWLFDGSGSFMAAGVNGLIPGVWAGLGVVLGHNFPVFLKFRGGKGIACTIGLLLMLDWRAALIIYLIAFLLVLITRYISVASLAITFFMPVSMAIFVFMALEPHAWEVVAVTAFLGVLGWYMHRENIQRLFSGTERKFSLKSKPL
ncbi:MAG: glycerol-3-phosphate 1-O-acyltransferase PlsY [Defluviitaleaceae bacterium]|nr:glycerol-3-phosphate 1-O-acyltransferase PlsY [Defluviitaleaceae bacterium]